MPSPVQRRAVDLTSLLRSSRATRYAARLISEFLRATRLEVGSRAGGWSRLVFILVVASCSSYWGQRPLDQPTPIDAKDPVLIWSSGGVAKWHAVVITQDSVSGIPYETSLKCTECRRSIPRAQVDSMKLYYRTLPENVTEVLGVTTLIILAELAAGLVVQVLR